MDRFSSLADSLRAQTGNPRYGQRPLPLPTLTVFNRPCALRSRAQLSVCEDVFTVHAAHKAEMRALRAHALFVDELANKLHARPMGTTTALPFRRTSARQSERRWDRTCGSPKVNK